jgi:hypothetical protein
MKRTPNAIYQTPRQLAERIRACEAEAAKLPPGKARRQAAEKEIAQLRLCLEAKLWIASPGRKRGR